MGCIFGSRGFVLFWLWGHYTDLISPVKLYIGGSKIENIGQILTSKRLKNLECNSSDAFWSSQGYFNCLSDLGTDLWKKYHSVMKNTGIKWRVHWGIRGEKMENILGHSLILGIMENKLSIFIGFIFSVIVAYPRLIRTSEKSN